MTQRTDNTKRGPVVIPPCSDVEAMAQFFETHPGWSPLFDENGVQIGVESPMTQALTSHIAKILKDQLDGGLRVLFHEDDCA